MDDLQSLNGRLDMPSGSTVSFSPSATELISPGQSAACRRVLRSNHTQICTNTMKALWQTKKNGKQGACRTRKCNQQNDNCLSLRSCETSLSHISADFSLRRILRWWKHWPAETPQANPSSCSSRFRSPGRMIPFRPVLENQCSIL